MRFEIEPVLIYYGMLFLTTLLVPFMYFCYRIISKTITYNARRETINQCSYFFKENKEMLRGAALRVFSLVERMEDHYYQAQRSKNLAHMVFSGLQQTLQPLFNLLNNYFFYQTSNVPPVENCRCSREYEKYSVNPRFCPILEKIKCTPLYYIASDHSLSNQQSEEVSDSYMSCPESHVDSIGSEGIRVYGNSENETCDEMKILFELANKFDEPTKDQIQFDNLTVSDVICRYYEIVTDLGIRRSDNSFEFNLENIRNILKMPTGENIQVLGNQNGKYTCPNQQIADFLRLSLYIMCGKNDFLRLYQKYRKPQEMTPQKEEVIIESDSDSDSEDVTIEC